MLIHDTMNLLCTGTLACYAGYLTNYLYIQNFSQVQLKVFYKIVYALHYTVRAHLHKTNTSLISVSSRKILHSVLFASFLIAFMLFCVIHCLFFCGNTFKCYLQFYLYTVSFSNERVTHLFPSSSLFRCTSAESPGTLLYH